METTSQDGFSMLELAVYSALFPLIITGIFRISFTLINAAAKTNEASLVETEGSFLLRKIEAGMQGSEIISPLPGSGSSELKLRKVGREGTIEFKNINGLLSLIRPTDHQSMPLNTPHVKVSDFRVQSIPANISDPKSINVEFKVNEQVFSFTTYPSF